MVHTSTFNTLVSTYPHITTLMLGVCIGIPFVFPLLLPLAYVAIGILFSCVCTMTPKQRLCMLSSVWGIKALLALLWFWSTYPIEWLPELSSTTQQIAIFLYWTTSALWLASAGVVIAVLYRYVPRITPLLQPWYIAGSVVVAEIIAAGIFSLCTIGPGASINTAFSFGHIGYLFPWLLPYAQFGGVYMVGFVGVGILCTILYWWQKNSRLFGYVLVCTIVSYPAVTYLLPNDIAVPSVALLQTTIDRTVPPEIRLTALNELAAVAVAQPVEYVLFPEDSRYFTTQYYIDEVGPQAAAEAFAIFNPTTTAMVIDSGRTIDRDTRAVVQRAYIIESGALLGTADKDYLVPQGEYMPSLYAFFLRLFGLGEAADYLAETINYESGSASLSGATSNRIPNILFCFESVSPLAAKRLQSKRPSDFIVHPMSHSWFHTPHMLWAQLEIMLRFQSVYAGVPIVSVGNDVRGKIYLPNGDTIEPQTVHTTPYGTIDIYN